MLKWLRPDHVVQFVTQIDVEELRDRGIRGLLLDLDNTLVAWNSHELEESVHLWLEWAQACDLSLCLVSNAKPGRIQRAIDPLEIPFVALARKPMLKGFRRAMKLLGTEPKQTAMIGDQVFTDVLGANLLGLHTILIELPQLPEQWWMKGTRRLERWVLRRQKAAALKALD